MDCRVLRAVGVTYLLLIATLAGAECPSTAEVASRVEAFLARKPVASYGKGLTVADGYCAQERYVARLAEKLGAPVGYKAAFTAKAMQERFGVTEPARGRLFGPLLTDGAELPATFGVRPMIEADLAVTVKDDGINDATTPFETLSHLDEVVPFIELPDMVVPEGEPLSGAVIIALNTFARSGVIGKGVPVRATSSFIDSLAAMEATLVDDEGKVLGGAKGESLLGNPANVVLWMVKSLKVAGQRLQKGDVLSLGAMGALVPAQAGRTYELRYEGLPGGTVSVRVRVR